MKKSFLANLFTSGYDERTDMNERLIITGGKPLVGKVKIRGSKNAATKMMVASILTEEPCAIENIPFSGDFDITRELCAAIGSEIEVGNDHRCVIVTEEIRNPRVSAFSRRNRIPILALGPLLHRQGAAEVPVLGGCPIGHRPVNFHLDALSAMGVRIERREQSYFAEAPNGIRGADIRLPYPSVGATENILLTAVCAQGKTVIRNAAVEPEILNLIEMLSGMGAAISVLAEERLITIKGVGRLRGVSARVMPDRIEAVSFAAAALATGGEVVISDIADTPVSFLGAFLGQLEEIGAECKVLPEGILFRGQKPYRPIKIETAPHPGFMTDWQQPFSVVLTQAEGESVIHETVFEDRFGYVKDLNRMGALITVSDECPEGKPCRFSGHTFNHTARLRGRTPLRGSEMRMTDVRAGMAHIIAALAAEGESVISGVEHLDRGYERIDERLRALGADITRIH